MSNPSVVSNEIGSQYNIARMFKQSALDPTNLAQSQQYIEQLQKMAAQTAVPGQLPMSAYFPGAGRGIQVGATQTQTLGTQPIFAAGTGLPPFELLQNWRRAKQAQEAVMYQPQETDEFYMPEIEELANMRHQAEFNEKIKQFVDDHLTAYANALGGNYLQAQKALKTDREFQHKLKQFDYFARAYNQIHGEAISILDRIQNRDISVSKEEKQAALDFVRGVGRLEDMSLEELSGMARKFQGRISLYKLADWATENVGERVLQRIQRIPGWSTNRAEAFRHVKEEGFSDAEIDELMEASLRITGMEDITSQERKDLKSTIKSRLDAVMEEQLANLSQHLQEDGEVFKEAGFNIRPDGSIRTTPVHSNVLETAEGLPWEGREGVVYPHKHNITFPIPQGHPIHVKQHGVPLVVYADEPIDIKAMSEYNARGLGLDSGRVVEGRLLFTGEQYETAGRGSRETVTGTMVRAPRFFRQDTGDPIEIMRGSMIVIDHQIAAPYVDSFVPGLSDHTSLLAEPDAEYLTVPKLEEEREKPPWWKFWEREEKEKPKKEAESKTEARPFYE